MARALVSCEICVVNRRPRAKSIQKYGWPTVTSRLINLLCDCHLILISGSSCDWMTYPYGLRLLETVRAVQPGQFVGLFDNHSCVVKEDYFVLLD